MDPKEIQEGLETRDRKESWEAQASMYMPPSRVSPESPAPQDPLDRRDQKDFQARTGGKGFLESLGSADPLARQDRPVRKGSLDL